MHEAERLRPDPPGGRDARIVALERLFREAPARAEWFAPAFLAMASAGTVAGIVADLERRNGAYRAVTGTGGGLAVRLLRADVPTQVTLDAQGRIAGLLFQPAVPTTGGLEDHVRAIAGLPGRSAALVTTDGRTRAGHAADLPLAVGSAFKLAVLRATAAACDGGRLAWDQVVRLDRAWRSLPSGVLQDWPESSPLTVATLAALMISMSDNTAADALLHLAGRAAVEDVSPRNAPFLSTRELFILKAARNGALRREWAAADAAGRRALLTRIAGLPLPGASDLVPEASLDLEWFLTAAELGALLEATRHLPSFHISQGPVAGTGRWHDVAYKGGSEGSVSAHAKGGTGGLPWWPRVDFRPGRGRGA